MNSYNKNDGFRWDKQTMNRKNRKWVPARYGAREMDALKTGNFQ